MNKEDNIAWDLFDLYWSLTDLTRNYLYGTKQNYMGLELSYSHGQWLFDKFVSNFTNNFVK